MKDKYVLTITNENNEVSMEIKDDLTGTKFTYTHKELSKNSEGFSVGWMCNKLVDVTKDKYRSIAQDELTTTSNKS